jgi:hypothetical protein
LTVTPKERAPSGVLATAWVVGLVAGLAAPRIVAARPWVPPGAVPVPTGAASVRIVRADEPIYQGPDLAAPRRGSARRSAYLPLYAAVRGPGCRGSWLEIGALAWVCRDAVELSPIAPLAANEPPATGPLPFQYHFVKSLGSLGYSSLDLAEEGIPDAEFEPGFAVAIVRVDRRSRHDPFGLSTKGFWVPMRDLEPARPSSFRGIATPNGRLDVAWVSTDSAAVHVAPGGARRPGALPRLTPLNVLDVVEQHGRRWLSVGDGAWVDAKNAAMPELSPPPAGVTPGERWLDVRLATQTLVAYQGSVPVFATLVSTGKGAEGTEPATPRGDFRVWVKLVTSDMDNLEAAEASRYYAMHDVPWVMFFERGYGLHGTYWHGDFGRVRSHGCVNLSPADAAWLFEFSGPRVPAGWTAALPTPYDRGTLVHVR